MLPQLPWLPHLDALHLQDNEIAELAPLYGLPSLRVLNLSFNRCDKMANHLRAERAARAISHWMVTSAYRSLNETRSQPKFQYTLHMLSLVSRFAVLMTGWALVALGQWRHSGPCRACS